MSSERVKKAVADTILRCDAQKDLEVQLMNQLGKHLDTFLETPTVRETLVQMRDKDSTGFSASYEIKEKDNVNHPPHYTSGDIECIDAIREATKHLSGFEGFLTGNCMKYLWRWKHKNGVEDLKKTAWYLTKLTTEVEGNDA